MKISLKVLLVLLFAPLLAWTFTKTGGGNSNVIGEAMNESGITFDKSLGVSVDIYDAQRIGATVLYSSVSYSNVTFSTNGYTAGSGNISITAHGLDTAIPVILRQTAGKIPPPLTAETTYFAINSGANVVQLATTSAKAQVLDPIIMVSSFPADGTQTYTLVIASSNINGYPTFTWEGSNDGSEYFTIVSSVAAVYNKLWNHDFGEFNYTTLRFTYTAPTYGPTDVKATINMKQR